MTDNTKVVLDIAQRIAEAMNSTSEPRPSCSGQFEPDEDTVIGEVPPHLRHLHNLLNNLGDEASDAESRFRAAVERHATVHAIFFDALKQHVPIDEDKFDGLKLCGDWQVVGFKRPDDDQEDGFAGLISAALMRVRRS